jgi:hypothetical protein
MFGQEWMIPLEANSPKTLNEYKLNPVETA